MYHRLVEHLMSEPTPQELEDLQAPENWDWDQPERHHGRTSTVTEICVRFAGPELQALAEAARRTQSPLAVFIHQAALRAAGYAATSLNAEASVPAPRRES